jgi:hypothetical protein
MTTNERKARWAERQAETMLTAWAAIEAKPWDRRHHEQQTFLLEEAARFRRIATALRRRDQREAA